MSSPERLRLLVSVRDEQEAADALAGGADWIDCKEPHVGALGAVSVDVARRVAQVVDGRCSLSAALGELKEWNQSQAQQLLSVPEVQVVKLGLSNCTKCNDWTSLWCEAFQAVNHAGKQLAAVIYADWQAACAPHPDEVLQLAREVGCQYLLIDTFEKKSASSLQIFSRTEVARLMHIARLGGMTTVIAGNLRAADFTQLADLPVDVVAVRGAACGGNRLARIDTELVKLLQSELSKLNCCGEIYQTVLTTLN